MAGIACGRLRGSRARGLHWPLDFHRLARARRRAAAPQPTPNAPPSPMGSFANFRQLDYLGLDDQFSEDELMVRDAVRSWVTERYLPIAMEHFENGTFPMELV